MQKYNLLSWIFLATGYSCINSPTTISKISETADGINHCVPTKEELEFSISWLEENDYIKGISHKYQLTGKGEKLFVRTQQKRKTIAEIWRELKIEFETLNKQH